MSTRSLPGPLALAFLAAALVAPGAASAQHVPLKTVPIATDEQFLLFPSDRLGMAGVSIAVDDASGDPWTA